MVGKKAVLLADKSADQMDVQSADLMADDLVSSTAEVKADQSAARSV